MPPWIFGWSVFTRPSEQLREAGHVLDAGHGQSRALEGFGRAAARDELEPDLGQTAGERLEAGLVVDGDQRAHSSRTTLGSNRCSAACTRSRRVSTESPASTGTGVACDDVARVDAAIDVVHGRGALGDTRREHVLERMRARERGQRCRVHVHDPARKPLEEPRREEMHVTGAHDELDPLRIEPVRERRVTRVSVLELVEREHGARHSGRRRTLERSRPGHVGRDRHDRQALVEQRLQVRPLARDQDADHVRTMRPITSSSPGSGTTAT